MAKPTAARIGPSSCSVEEIAIRERELQGIADRLASGEVDPGEDLIERIRNFVHINLADIRRVVRGQI
jgi:hypothetical protein